MRPKKTGAAYYTSFYILRTRIHSLCLCTSYSSGGTGLSSCYPLTKRTASCVASISMRVRQSTDIEPMCAASTGEQSSFSVKAKKEERQVFIL